MCAVFREQHLQCLRRPSCRAGLRADGFEGMPSQGCAVDIIFQQFHEYKRQFRGAHNPYRIAALKQADDVAEIFGVVPHHDGDAIERRLNNIVSAFWN